MKCRLCDSEATRPYRLIQSPFYDVKYKLYQCDDCTSRFFNPEDHDISLSEMYEKLAKNNLQSGDVSKTFLRSPYWEGQVSCLLRMSSKPVQSVLDIGCRTGDFLMHFHDEVQREGVELSETYAAIAAGRGIEVYNDYQENIEFDKQYDIVAAYAIVEHTVRPSEFLTKISELVSPKGLLVIMIPTYQCIKEKVVRIMGKRWHMYSPPAHLNFPSRRFLDSFLFAKGLTLAHRSYRGSGFPNPFAGVRYLRGVYGLFTRLYDDSIFNRLRIFDHMYSVYSKVE